MNPRYHAKRQPKLKLSWQKKREGKQMKSEKMQSEKRKISQRKRKPKKQEQERKRKMTEGGREKEGGQPKLKERKQTMRTLPKKRSLENRKK